MLTLAASVTAAAATLGAIASKTAKHDEDEDADDDDGRCA